MIEYLTTYSICTVLHTILLNNIFVICIIKDPSLILTIHYLSSFKVYLIYLVGELKFVLLRKYIFS
jgi:hypothetical protein